MNQVFVRRPVGCRAIPAEAAIRELKDIAALIVGGVAGGALMAAVIFALGSATLTLDPSPRHAFALMMTLAFALVALIFEARAKIHPLPERQRQVPRRWLTWSKRALTAAAFGVLLGAGAFTHLWHASMYLLALFVFTSPNLGAALALGALYGGNRMATVLYAWFLKAHDASSKLTLGRHTGHLLVLAGSALPVWIIGQLTV
jgi:hypothetical protein